MSCMSCTVSAAAYPASKAALNALTVQYAKELRADGILVNAVTPERAPPIPLGTWP
jgi:NAD(P)-dependent dehydrogenase (short-subunit alcohol dehydrogenase family)